MAKKKVKATGKRARAKAKLDRQWGEEEVKGDPSRVYRRGFSNQNGQRQKKRVAVETFASEDVSQQQKHSEMHDESDSTDDEDDLSDDNNNPLRNLLGKIHACKNGMGTSRSRGSEKKSKSNLSDEELEELQSESVIGGDDGEDLPCDVDNGDEDLVIIPDVLSSDGEDDDRQLPREDDLYANHFGREPLDDEDIVNFSSHWGSGEQVLNKNLAAAENRAPMTDVENLKLFAAGPINDILSRDDRFSPNIRVLLRSHWPKFNRKNMDLYGDGLSGGLFTLLQSTLYSSLSSYADLLVTTETREVR